LNSACWLEIIEASHEEDDALSLASEKFDRKMRVRLNLLSLGRRRSNDN
jgi:hypothetical protein